MWKWPARRISSGGRPKGSRDATSVRTARHAAVPTAAPLSAGRLQSRLRRRDGTDVPGAAARRAARGDPSFRLWTETIVDVMSTAPREHLAILRQDVHYAFRSLVRAPLFALASIATMAVGIGGVAVVAAAINGFIVRPLPVDRPDELVSVTTRDAHAPVPHGLSFLDLQDYRTNTSGRERYGRVHGPSRHARRGQSCRSRDPRARHRHLLSRARRAAIHGPPDPTRRQPRRERSCRDRPGVRHVDDPLRGRPST